MESGKNLNHFNYLKKANKFDIGFIFILGLVCFLSGFCFQPFINFEARFALFAQDIFRNGLQFYPTIYNVPYPDYPALSIWLIYFSSWVFGGLVKISAIFPTAIASALIMVFTYLIAALYSRRWAWYAVLILLSSLYFVQSSRTISLDQYVSLVTVVLGYVIIRFCEQDKTKASANVSLKAAGLIMFILFLGVWFRGPMGLVIPGGAAAGILLAYQQYKNIFIFAGLCVAVLVVSLLVLLGMAYCQGGESFLREVLVMQVTGRMHPGHGYPAWFYLQSLFFSYQPGFIIVLGLMAFAFPKFINTKPEKKLLLAMLFWLLIVVIGMSIPGGKKTRYLLPIMPAIALIASWMWLYKDAPKYLLWIKKITNCLFFMVPILFCVAIYIEQQHYQQAQASLIFMLHTHIQFLYVFFIGVLILQIAYLFSRKKLNFRYEVVLLICLVLQIVVAQIFLVQPVLNYINRAQGLVQQVETFRQEGEKIYFYKITHDGGDNVYFVNAFPAQVPAVYITTSEELFNLPGESLVLMHQKDYMKLTTEQRGQLIEVAHGRFGRRDVVAVEVPEVNVGG